VSEAISAGHLLHTQLEVAAQDYLSKPNEIGATRASVQDAIAVYNGRTESEEKAPTKSDSPFMDLEVVRTEREPQIAALARVVGDRMIRKLLYHTDESGLDITALGSDEAPNAYHTFLDGVAKFMDDTADEVSTDLKDPKHAYNPLYRLFADTHRQFMDASIAASAEGNAKRNGTQLDWGFPTLPIEFYEIYSRIITGILVPAYSSCTA
jgi:hypothetical protein